VEHAILVNWHHLAESKQITSKKISCELKFQPNLYKIVMKGNYDDKNYLFRSEVRKALKAPQQFKQEEAHRAKRKAIVATIAGEGQRIPGRCFYHSSSI
jgi:hypothetical protein